MKKKLLHALAAVLTLAAVLAGLAYYWMGQPLYRPGMARALISSTPQNPTDEGPFWKMGPGARLHHSSEGAGRNLLFVHGGPGSPMREAAPGLKLLASTHRLVFYHQRGCGMSERPIDRFYSRNYYANMKQLDAALGLAAQVADIERIRRLLGDEQMVVMGHSFGGFLASLYAAEFPEHIKGLVLVAPAALLTMPLEDGGLMEQVRRDLPEEMQASYADFLKRYFDFGGMFEKSESQLSAQNAEFGRYYRAAAQKRNFAVPAAEEKDTGGWMVEAMYMGMGRRHDYRAAMAKVTASVLVIHGERDIQPEKTTRDYAAAFPRARVDVIRDAGHFPFIDQPETFAAITGAFLKEIQ